MGHSQYYCKGLGGIMSICQSKDSIEGYHRVEWRSNFTGGGYWVCLNSGCGEVELELTGHHGG